MDTLLLLVLCTLAAFRLSEMVVIDDGPFDVFIELRGWANQPPLDDHPLRRTLAGVLSCVHCSGVWFSILAGVYYYFFQSANVWNSILFFLAVAGAQSVLANKLGRNIQ